jgi:hypothetical protein
MTLKVMRRVGAVAVIGVGAVHLQQYLTGYDAIPTIGPLFLLNAIGSGLVALGLLLPIERWLDARRGEIAIGLLAFGGVTIGLGSLVGLYIAETSTLFGFSEGTFETVMWIAVVSEVAAALLLIPVAVANLVGPSARRAPAAPRAVRS